MHTHKNAQNRQAAAALSSKQKTQNTKHKTQTHTSLLSFLSRALSLSLSLSVPFSCCLMSLSSSFMKTTLSIWLWKQASLPETVSDQPAQPSFQIAAVVRFLLLCLDLLAQSYLVLYVPLCEHLHKFTTAQNAHSPTLPLPVVHLCLQMVVRACCS